MQSTASTGSRFLPMTPDRPRMAFAGENTVFVRWFTDNASLREAFLLLSTLANRLNRDIFAMKSPHFSGRVELSS
jgi:hypothetical protein